MDVDNGKKINGDVKAQSSGTGTPAERYQVALNVGAQFLYKSDEIINKEIVTGHTRDISANGIGVRLPDVPSDLARILNTKPGQIRAIVDLTLGKKIIRLKTHLTWFKDVHRGENHECFCGADFLDADSYLIQKIIHYAERKKNRPRLIRYSILTIILLLLASWFVYWQTSKQQDHRITVIENELAQAAQNKKELATALLGAKSELKEIQSHINTTEAVLAEKEKVIQELSDRYEQSRTQVGHLAVNLANIKMSAIEAKKENAAQHMERGYLFMRHDNLAAALLEFTKAIELDPDRAESFLEIASINELYGYNQKAIKAYEKYLQLRPHASDSLEIRETIRQIKDYERRLRQGLTEADQMPQPDFD